MNEDNKTALSVLTGAGVTVQEVAAETGYSMRPLSNGSTSAGDMLYRALRGVQTLTPRMEAAIRALVPGRVADEVLRLAAEARGARRG